MEANACNPSIFKLFKLKADSETTDQRQGLILILTLLRMKTGTTCLALGGSGGNWIS